MKTNIGLAAYAQKAYRENWGYLLGGYGTILTQSFLNAKMKQAGRVGTYNTKHQAYLRRFMGKRVTDCYGLIKGYLWTRADGSVPYNAKQDRNQEMAYNAAKEKGPLRTLPEIPGIVLWMKGHAGVYIGNGEFIECAGVPVGMRKGKIVNGRVTSGARFTHWFKDTHITYSGSAPVRSYFRNGDKGDEIRQLQLDLNELGYKLKVDGDFGVATEGAVRDFQLKNGLVVDGFAGIKTIAKLAERLSAGPALLRQGSKGDAVRKLQTDLNKFGFNLKVDGDFGIATHGAVRDFQMAMKITVDGIAGPVTLEKLDEKTTTIKVIFERDTVDIPAKLENGVGYVKVLTHDITVKAAFEALGFKVTKKQGSTTLHVTR